MRIALLLAFLAAAGCGKRDRESKAGLDLGSAAADDERCDPAESRVCVGNSVVACDEGVLGRRLRTCHDGCKNGTCVATCEADGVELIYVVDTSDHLLSFDPRKLPADPFKLIGKLDCTTLGSPFSMSVDRNGMAWVLYGTGDVFKVSITDAKCKPSGYRAGSNGHVTFGMGFVTDDAKGKTEKLYVAANDGTRALGFIDTDKTPPPLQDVGTLDATRDQNPELTGTSEAKLFGFYPVLGEPSFVQEIDRRTGGPKGQRWTLGTDPLGPISAYAFAQWGGVFYIFVTIDGETTVRTVDRRTGSYKTVLQQVPWRISGAGVSTCAPELDAAGSGSGP